ncbi:GSAP [Bugula neritina]|uniref:GSAP n=1 Tax=Bugula neritina TaxID=10212 RepID=A0A7J7KPX6_BUGNE|nr:GSAP [Bugula neritina]
MTNQPFQIYDEVIPFHGLSCKLLKVALIILVTRVFQCGYCKSKLKMLQFHEIINLKEEVSKGLNAESWISHSGDILIPDSVCIVGKERDCSFLFRCVTQNGAGSNQQSMPSLKKRTHIGIFSLQDNRVRTLLTLDKEEEIIHCTVNEQQTLLDIGVVQLAVDSAGKLKDKVAKRYKPDWIIGKHFWYQWDVDKQHLFTITSDNSDMGGFLDVYQPSERTTLDKLFSIPIMIDTSRRPRLSKFNLEQRSQDRNIVVLTNNDNTTNAVLCLCNQEPYKRRNPNEPDLPFTLSYEIISFVHEKSLRISVPNVPSKLRKMCIHFTLIGNYVVAYLPDVFTHVINVQDIADLGALNIICGGESHSRVAECKSTLSRLNLSRLYTKPGTYMFDSDSMYIYNIVFNDQAIEAKFAEKWPQEIHAYPAVSPRSLTNQLAVLQQVLQSTADAKKPRKLFDYMMNDAASTDCIQILTEYLLGSSFAVTSRRNEVIKVFCCLLPFTSSQTQESHKVSVFFKPGVITRKCKQMLTRKCKQMLTRKCKQMLTLS